MKIEDQVKQFHRDGFLVMPEVLARDQAYMLRLHLQQLMSDQTSPRRFYVFKRLFEESLGNLHLFEQEPVVTFAETLFRDELCMNGRKDFTTSALECHVIHNNGLVTPPGSKGVVPWHQDDPPHFVVTDNRRPTNIHLPCLIFTANYYLTDVTKVEHGPTHCIRGSHLWGKVCPSELDESKYDVVPCLGKAGTAVLFNCQTWHRGGANNTTDQTRYVSQVTYGRRMVGHKYFPFMDYQLPAQVKEAMENNPRLRRLVGFLSSGAYG